jgi:hypothetical protein
MAFAPDVYQKIADRLRERRILGGEMPDRWQCWYCGDSRWTLGDGFVTLVLSYGSSPFQPSGNTLPSLALICQTCGNTVLLNLLVLGLGDLIGVHTPELATR